MSGNIKKGIIFALITSTVSGVSIFYNKLVLIQGIDPFVLNIIKNGGAAFIFSLMILLTSQRSMITKLSPTSWLKLFIIGIIGGSIPFLLYFEGLRLTSPVSANLIHKTMFLWVALVAVPFMGEKLNFLQAIGYLLVILSNFFIGGFTGFTGGRGEMLIFLATILWSAESIIVKIALSNINYKIIAWARMFLGSIILLMIAAIQHKSSLLINISPSVFLPLTGSIILLTFYLITWFKALKYAPVTLATSIFVLATVITNILTAIFINHSLSGLPAVNTMFIVFGVTLIASVWINRTHKFIGK